MQCAISCYVYVIGPTQCITVTADMGSVSSLVHEIGCQLNEIDGYTKILLDFVSSVEEF